MTDELVMWCGRPLEKLTKEELIEALKIMGKQNLAQHESTAKLFELFRLCRARSS